MLRIFNLDAVIDGEAYIVVIECRFWTDKIKCGFALWISGEIKKKYDFYIPSYDVFKQIRRSKNDSKN